MTVYKVTSKSGTVIGFYESYDLAEFHCTDKLYDITPIEIITKMDMINLIVKLPEQRVQQLQQLNANDELYPDFAKNLEGLGQQSLIELFFDWWDNDQHDSTEVHKLKLYEIRKRINIQTTTGIKENVK